jgi:hypothetical protein
MTSTNSNADITTEDSLSIANDIIRTTQKVTDQTPSINFHCANNNTSNSGVSIVNQIVDLIKKLLLGSIFVISMIVIIGCSVFVISGRPAFEDYWTYNLDVVKAILSMTERTVDRVVPDVDKSS